MRERERQTIFTCQIVLRLPSPRTRREQRRETCMMLPLTSTTIGSYIFYSRTHEVGVLLQQGPPVPASTASVIYAFFLFVRHQRGFITQLHLHQSSAFAILQATPPTSSFCLSLLLLHWGGRCWGCDRRSWRGGVCCSSCLVCRCVTPSYPCELTLGLEGMTVGDDCIMTVIVNVNPAAPMLLPSDPTATPFPLHPPQLCYSVHSNESAPPPKFTFGLLRAPPPSLRQTISADK